MKLVTDGDSLNLKQATDIGSCQVQFFDIRIIICLKIIFILKGGVVDCERNSEERLQEGCVEGEVEGGMRARSELGRLQVRPDHPYPSFDIISMRTLYASG